MAKVRISGLPNCDSCKSARKALEAAGFEIEFRDLRKDPPSREEILKLWQAFGPSLLNKASTTWRGLSDAEKAQEPVALLAEHPVLMKRPVVEDAQNATIGWTAAVQKQWLG